jgi:uncharacterized RDD family membrane protein YckC
MSGVAVESGMICVVTEEDELWEPVLPLVDDYAGDTRVVWLRVGQFALDVLLVQVIVLAVAALATGLAHLVLGDDDGLLLVLIAVLCWLWLSLLGCFLVTVLWPMLHHGRTPAMRWCGLRVITLQGEEPPPAAHVIRCLLTVVDGFPFGLIGLVTMTNSRRQQRLGDIVARTVVVRDR